MQNLPCHVRKHINEHTDDVLPVKTPEGDMYMFDLTKLDSKTRICGTQYKQFLEDFNLGKCDQIRFQLKKSKPFLRVTALDSDGIEKERVEGSYLYFSVSIFFLHITCAFYFLFPNFSVFLQKILILGKKQLLLFSQEGWNQLILRFKTLTS